MLVIIILQVFVVTRQLNSIDNIRSSFISWRLLVSWWNHFILPGIAFRDDIPFIVGRRLVRILIPIIGRLTIHNINVIGVGSLSEVDALGRLHGFHEIFVKFGILRVKIVGGFRQIDQVTKCAGFLIKSLHALLQFHLFNFLFFSKVFNKVFQFNILLSKLIFFFFMFHLLKFCQLTQIAYFVIFHLVLLFHQVNFVLKFRFFLVQFFHQLHVGILLLEALLLKNCSRLQQFLIHFISFLQFFLIQSILL